MKLWRILASSAALSLVLVATSEAQWQHIIETQLKPGQDAEYEALVKAVKEAADKVGSNMNWAVFQVVAGKQTPTYRIVLPYEKWADREGWESALSVLAKAHGEAEAKRMWEKLTSMAVSSTAEIWQGIPEGSANVPTSGSPANFYDVTVRTILRGHADEYRAAQRTFKKAYEAMPTKPVVIRSVLAFGDNANQKFRRAEAFSKFGEMDSFGLRRLRDQMGEDLDPLVDRLGEIVVNTEHFISAYRPDLSRMTGGTTSNN